MLIDISNTVFQILHNGAISNNHLILPLCTLLHIRPPHFPPPLSQTSPSLAQVLAWSHNHYPATTLSIFAPHYPRASKKTFCLLSGVQESALTRWCPVHVHRTCPNHLKHLLFNAILILSHLHNLFRPSIDTTYCQWIPKILTRHLC